MIEMMEKQGFISLFKQFLTLHEMDTLLTDGQIEQFYDLTCYMTEKNQVMNITAIREVERIIPLHYMDCLLAVRYIPHGAKVLDIGCGGGFPTLPLAIACPDITVIGVDSTEKKVRYVQETADRLGLKVSTIAARAEELAQDPLYREQFDIVTSRAVARLHILDELCLPFVRIGGQAVILKGAAGAEELEEATVGIETLGGDINDLEELTLMVTDGLNVPEKVTEQRAVILIDKVRKTPVNYPRSFGQIKKKPL